MWAYWKRKQIVRTTTSKTLKLCSSSKNLLYLVKNAGLNCSTFNLIKDKIVLSKYINKEELDNVEQLHFLMLKLNCLSIKRIQICINAVEEKFLSLEK